MNELISIISSEIKQTRYGLIQFTLTMHNGEIRCVNVIRNTRHNITSTKAKDIKDENRNREN